MQREFDVAVGDIAIGLDPDLYPLLASTQTLSGGSNVVGVQDPTLDRLLATARAPGTEAERKEAYTKLQEHLAKSQIRAPVGVRGRDDGGPRGGRRTGRPPGFGPQ